MSEVLSVQNVVKYYGYGGLVTKALDGISFSVEKGEFVAIMGASGSGKSTLLNVISTIDRVSAGDIFLEGVNIAAQKESKLPAFRRDRLGFIFQEYNLLDTLTVRENIELPLTLKRTAPEKVRAAVQQAAESLGIAEQLGKFPYQLSGGQRQRVACARALVTNPAMILADEPTGALDSQNSRNLMKIFEQMNRSFHATILMVTHDPEVGSYAHRVLFLKDGKLWSEADRGNRSRRELYQEILSVMAAFGGEVDVE